MKGFDVLKVKSAVKNHNKFDLSRSHLTTMNFGEIVPLLAEETVPGDKFNISGNYFSRMAPLAKPTYGKFQFKTVAGFVPYHQIAWDSDAWFAGKTVWEGQTPHGRFISVLDLEYFFRTYCCTTSGATATNCDYSVIAQNGNTAYYLFTNIGRYFVKVMNALGYALPQGVDLQTGSTWLNTIGTIKLSAYPLLAFFKLYNDYMSQSQRFNTSALSNILQCVKYGKSLGGFTPSTGAIGGSLIKNMFDNLFLNYENDYFTSAWQEPNCALGTIESINAGATPGSNGTVSASVNDNVIAQSLPVSGSVAALSLGQRALDFLKDFDNWVRRNNYSGSRAVQQVYSRFGIKTDDYRSHYAQVLTTDSMPIQVGDVTATANTSTGVSNLGEYAGKGIMNGNKGVSCQVSDYGIILILGYFTVTPMNAYGFDRKVLRSNPLDYYNPEFDGLGADAIPLMEYYENPRGVADSDTTTSDSVYGFTERYNSYRFGRDQITGEFRKYKTDDMNCWHTGRLLGAVRKAGNLVAQSSSVNTLPQTDSEYNRIFSITSGDVDHFYLTAHFNVDAVRPMMNLNQVPRLGEGDTIVPRNGNIIS